jgi:hypothetical protein
MRPKKPTSFTAFASDMISQSRNVVINDKKLSLSYDEKFFFDESLHIDLEDIETFAFREDCPILYLLDTKGTVHSYDIYRKSIQKEIFNVQLDDNTSCIDMVLSPTVLYVLDQNGLKAFSLITWQLLWETNIGDAQSICINEKGYIYIATKSSNLILKYDTGGSCIDTLIIDNVENPISITIHQMKGEKSKFYILDNSKVIVYDANEFKEAICIRSSVADLWWDEKEGLIENQLSTSAQSIKKIIFDVKDRLFVLDTEGFISIISLQKSYKQSGEIAYIFDSTEPGCDWHKMEVDYEILDQKGSVTISVGAVDIRGQLPTITTEFENKKISICKM